MVKYHHFTFFFFQTSLYWCSNWQSKFFSHGFCWRATMLERWRCQNDFQTTEDPAKDWVYGFEWRKSKTCNQFWWKSASLRSYFDKKSCLLDWLEKVGCFWLETRKLEWILRKKIISEGGLHKQYSTNTFCTSQLGEQEQSFPLLLRNF